MGVQRLLQILNNVLGTDVQLDGKGVRQCLEYFINGSIVGRALHRIDDETQHFNTMQSVRPMDFGQAYAHWRTVKNADFSHFLRTLEDRRLADEAMRRDAVHGTYISNAELPPRRLWDLLSNRIVPFHLVSEGPIPPNIWTVSHSWCHPTARRSIETSINAYQWPVPVPGVLDDDQKTQDPDTMTTLEHVRVELLNYGAEYAWLDILCIRQRGNPQGEALRAEEWRTDIPTIGYIYSHKLPCVIYFNGLGLPLKLDEVTLHSERHWLNRVWTLQEGTRQWLLGGATEATLATSQACAFFQESLSDAILQRYQGQRSDAVQAIQKRHCESDLDRVHGLAYVFGCITLPIYDLNMTPDEAWVLLLKHIDPEFRREIVGLHLKHNPQSASLLPSLEEYKEYSSYNQSFSDPERIPMLYYNLAKPVHLVDERSLGDSEPGIYFQDVIHLGELSVSQFALSNHTHKLEVCTPLLEHFRWKNTSTKYCIYGRYNPGIKYDVVSFGRDVSLVVQVVGEMEVDGQTVQRVVKCGLIEWSGSAVYYGAWLPGHIRQWVERRIVYVQDYNVQRVPYNVYR
ncbi:hypothetical protein PsYK624_122880 [Phanerochaete sordida]|uniref:Heterokaryon incompatibility domain-containing protein n=1 Tax=Phanerochaete sordida TaxID=48140 RepID=A0A9P3GJ58_9APHY|nr:hypothetical protein PsYK624_122880 [Phanerochaete sordida]